MGEWTTAAGVGVEASASDELGIAGLDTLDSIQDHLHIREVDFSVAVEVRHLAVPFLVDVDVGGVSELVPAIAGASLAADIEVVDRRSEARANPQTLGVHAVIVQILDHQLELVEEWLAENDVLGPYIRLAVGNEIPQSEMLGHPRVFIVGCHFNEA